VNLKPEVELLKNKKEQILLNKSRKNTVSSLKISCSLKDQFWAAVECESETGSKSVEKEKGIKFCQMKAERMQRLYCNLKILWYYHGH